MGSSIPWENCIKCSTDEVLLKEHLSFFVGGGGGGTVIGEEVGQKWGKTQPLSSIRHRERV